MLTDREKFMASQLYQRGSAFYLSEIADRAGISLESAEQVVRELIDEGLVARAPTARKLQVAKYYRLSTTRTLLSQRWDRNLDLSELAA